MLTFPLAAEPAVRAFAPCLSDRVFRRFVLLLVGAVLAPRRRCVTAVLRVLGPLAEGHFGSYHRVLSHARFSMWRLGRMPARLVVAALPADEPVVLAVDDTVARHGGPKVYGRRCHRDPVRSSHGITVCAWGHRWVVTAVVVRFPGLSRPWALPVLACLCRGEKWCAARGRRLKRWPVIARQMTAAMHRWFPRRRFVLLGDGGFATHDLACLAHRHRGRLTFVCRFYDDAALTAPPGPKAKLGRGKGRPPKYGAKLPGPGATVARAGGRLAHARVGWYGGGRRDVRLLSGVGGWQRGARPLVPVRWVYVLDDQGTHRDDYLAATDPSLRLEQVVGLYTLRWPLGTTFQECRAHLGLETPRQRSERSVLRTTPLLPGLFTLLTLIWRRCPPGRDGRFCAAGRLGREGGADVHGRAPEGARTAMENSRNPAAGRGRSATVPYHKEIAWAFERFSAWTSASSRAPPARSTSPRGRRRSRRWPPRRTRCTTCSPSTPAAPTRPACCW